MVKYGVPTVLRGTIAAIGGVGVSVGRVKLRMAALPPGKRYTATADVSYKGKRKNAEAKVVSVKPVPGSKLVDVAVAVDTARSRTTEVTVTSVDVAVER